MYYDGDSLKGVLYFASFDCSDIAYMDVQDAYDIKKVGDNYFIGEKVTPVNMKINSMLSHFDTACKSDGFDRVVVPALMADPPFSLPVALPLSFDH